MKIKTSIVRGEEINIEKREISCKKTVRGKNGNTESTLKGEAVNSA